MGEVEGEIDTFVSQGFKSDFRLSNWLMQKELKTPQTRKIKEHLQSLLNELQEAKEGKDSQLSEGYAFAKGRPLTRWIKFIQGMITDCETKMAHRRAERKPRKRTQKPAGELVQGVKYKKEDKVGTLALKSISPVKLIGAQEVWFYHSKWHAMIRGVASTKDGFTVKGTTLKGYDPSLSTYQRVRNPVPFIKQAQTAKKTVLRKLSKKIGTKAKPWKGRMNDGMVIIRVI